MKSSVHFIAADSREPAALLAEKAKKVYLATGFNDRIAEGDFAALKIHFGEAGNTGHIKPQWLAGLIWEIRQKTKHAFLTDSNTLYVGNRSNSIDHLRLAWSHGFTPETTGLPVIIADGLIGRDKQEPRSAQARTASSKIASAILDADVLVGLTHVTGHVQTGLGAAIKNIGMGCASRAGKLEQHSVTHPRVNAKQCRNCSVCMAFCPEAAIVQAEGHVVIDPAKCIGCGECLVVCKFGAIKMKWDEDSLRLQEKMAEYALRVVSHFPGQGRFRQLPHPGHQGLRLHGQGREAHRARHRDPGFPRPGGRRPGHGRSPRRRRRRQGPAAGRLRHRLVGPARPRREDRLGPAGLPSGRDRLTGPAGRGRHGCRRRCGMRTARAVAPPSITPAPIRTAAVWPKRSAVTPTPSAPRGINPKKTSV